MATKKPSPWFTPQSPGMSFGPLKHFRFSRRPPFFKISSKFELLNPDRPIAAVNSFDDKAGPITVLEKGQVEVINNMEKLKPQKSLSPPKVENQETLKKRRLRKASAVKFFRPESTEGNPNAQTQVEGEKTQITEQVAENKEVDNEIKKDAVIADAAGDDMMVGEKGLEMQNTVDILKERHKAVSKDVLPSEITVADPEVAPCNTVKDVNSDISSSENCDIVDYPTADVVAVSKERYPNFTGGAAPAVRKATTFGPDRSAIANIKKRIISSISDATVGKSASMGPCDNLQPAIPFAIQTKPLTSPPPTTKLLKHSPGRTMNVRRLTSTPEKELQKIPEKKRAAFNKAALKLVEFEKEYGRYMISLPSPPHPRGEVEDLKDFNFTMEETGEEPRCEGSAESVITAPSSPHISIDHLDMSATAAAAGNVARQLTLSSKTCTSKATDTFGQKTWEQEQVLMKLSAKRRAEEGSKEQEKAISLCVENSVIFTDWAMMKKGWVVDGKTEGDKAEIKSEMVRMGEVYGTVEESKWAGGREAAEEMKAVETINEDFDGLWQKVPTRLSVGAVLEIGTKEDYALVKGQEMEKKIVEVNEQAGEAPKRDINSVFARKKGKKKKVKGSTKWYPNKRR